MHQNGKSIEEAARLARQASAIGMDAPTLQVLLAMSEELQALRRDISEMKTAIGEIAARDDDKEWYTTTEVADAMNVTPHTVAARWCATGKIRAEKDQATGKWRIPAYEFSRLRRREP